MRRIIAFVLIFVLLLGCTYRPNYEWKIQDSEYKYEEFNTNNEKKNVVLIEKSHNTESNEKKLSFRIYCHHYDIAGIIIAIKFSNNEDEFKENFYETIKSVYNIEMDSYIEGAIDDLYLDFDKNYEVINELSEIYKNNFDKCLIITLGNGEITYEDWNGELYSVRNGSEKNINFESKIYLGTNDAYH